MSNTAEGFTGHIIVVAELEAKPDKVSELEKAFMTIKARANSDAEPGCLTYRLNKFGNKFVLYEEYENQAALKLHISGDAFQALAKVIQDLTVIKPKPLFYEECKL